MCWNINQDPSILPIKCMIIDSGVLTDAGCPLNLLTVQHDGSLALINLRCHRNSSEVALFTA